MNLESVMERMRDAKYLANVEFLRELIQNLTVTVNVLLNNRCNQSNKLVPKVNALFTVRANFLGITFSVVWILLLLGMKTIQKMDRNLDVKENVCCCI